MKTMPWLALALILGLVLGGWAPRADLRQARAEIARLKEEQRRQARPRSDLGPVAAFLPIPGATGPAARDRPATKGRTPAPARTPSDRGARHSSHDPSPPGQAATVRPAPGERFEDQIRQASELWRTRAELARNTFIANVTATDEEEVFFDAAIETMNARLTEGMRRWADTIRQEQTMSPELGLRMMNDLSGTLVQTYDELDQGLPPDWRGRAGNRFQLFDLIDPEVAMPLADVQDVFARHGEGVDGSANGDGAGADAVLQTHPLTTGARAREGSTPASPAPRR